MIGTLFENEQELFKSVLKIHCNNVRQIHRLYQEFIKGNKYSLLTNDKVLASTSAGCYIINDKGVEAFHKKYYNEELNSWQIEEDYVLADVVTFYIDKVYSYNYPICLNNITKSNNYDDKINLFEVKANKLINSIHGVK